MNHPRRRRLMEEPHDAIEADFRQQERAQTGSTGCV
jgi:hypothetical protein